MNKVVNVCVCAFLLLTLALSAADASSNRMTRGMFDGVRDERIVVELPDGSRESFGLTRDTEMIRDGKSSRIVRIPRHSIIQVISSNGTALQIVVVEVPK